MATYSYKGVDYEFVNTQTELLEELKCPICLQLVSDPVQTSCGHLFCEECIEDIEECPVDRSEFTTTPDHFNNRRVRNFRVKCPNKGRSCRWQGSLGDAKKHTDTSCEYQFVECSNEGCDEEIERRYLLDHMHNKCPERMYNCPYCDEEDTYLEVTTTHFTECDDMPLMCPGGCGKRGLVRSDMEDHLSDDCPNELVPCIFAIAGCKKIVKRNDLQQHLQDKDQHFDTILSSYVSLSLLVRDMLYGNTPNVPLAFRPWLQNTPTCYPCAPWVFKMEGFRKKKENNTKWFSDPLYSHFGGYKMCLCVYANGVGDGKGTNVSVHICMMRGDHDNSLKWPFEGNMDISLLNQLEDSEHHDNDSPRADCDMNDGFFNRVTEGDKSPSFGDSIFISHANLNNDDDDENTQYLKDDTLFFRVNTFECEFD